MPDANELWTYLNGRLVRGADAVVPIRDRGILWGDAVYDSIRTYNGVPFQRDYRIDRFFRSLNYARIDPGLSKDELFAATEQVLEANRPLLGSNDDLSMNLYVSRGSMALADGDSFQPFNRKLLAACCSDSLCGFSTSSFAESAVA